MLRISAICCRLYRIDKALHQWKGNLTPLLKFENMLMLKLGLLSPSQVFFTVPAPEHGEKIQSRRLRWLFNQESKEADCPWYGCSVRPVVPCQVAPEFRHLVSVLETSSPLEKLPRHAIRTGIFMDAKTLVKFATSNGVKEPCGTGNVNAKTGKAYVNKEDWAKAVVQHFFPSEPEEEQGKMTAALLGKKKRQTFECASTIVDCVKSLDPEDANLPMFRQIKEMAEQQQKENALAPRGLF